MSLDCMPQLVTTARSVAGQWFTKEMSRCTIVPVAFNNKNKKQGHSFHPEIKIIRKV